MSAGDPRSSLASHGAAVGPHNAAADSIHLGTKDVCAICRALLVNIVAYMTTRSEPFDEQEGSPPDLEWFAEREREVPCSTCTLLIHLLKGLDFMENFEEWRTAAGCMPDHYIPVQEWLGVDTEPACSSVELRRMAIDDLPGDLTRAKQWLHDCRTGHEKCKAESPGHLSNLPSRVVQIVDSNTVCLVSGETLTGTYVTLSYCWGGKLPLKTLKANLADHERSIPRASLPRLFQDAVLVTEQLGLKYIWIDSLCIVQDDMAEWEAEAANMASVFRNSHVTLAATAARNPSAGLFPGISVAVDLRLKQRMRGPDGNVVGIRAHPSQKYALESARYLTFNLHKAAEPVEDIVNAPLNSRGWTLQELMLSRRTLHFTANQMYWHCNDLAVSSDTSYLDLKGMLIGEQGYYGPDMGIVTLDRPERFSRWWELVTDYSNRSLTFESDKQIALQGIVTALKERQPDNFIYGHWHRDFPSGLLWTPRDLVAQNHTPSDNLPTWSWLSSKVRVSTFFNLANISKHLAHVLVHGSVIRLQCHLLITTSRPAMEENNSYPIELEVVTADSPMRTLRIAGRLDWLVSDAADCIPMAAIPITNAIHRDFVRFRTTFTLRFLLVTPTGAAPQVYRRIGIGVARDEDAHGLLEFVKGSDELEVALI